MNIRRKISKVIAVMLTVVMAFATPMTYVQLKADEVTDINVTGVLLYDVQGDVNNNGGHWRIWLKTDNIFTDNAGGYNASSEPIVIKSAGEKYDVVHPAYGVWKDAGYMLLDIWGEYTKNHIPEKGNIIVIPTLTITNSADNTTYKIAKRAIIEFDGTSWNLKDDVLNIDSCYSYTHVHAADGGSYWNFKFNIDGEWQTEGMYNAPEDYKITIKNAAGDEVATLGTGLLNWLRDSDDTLYMNMWGEYTKDNDPEVGDTMTIPAVKLTSQNNSELGETIASGVVFEWNGTNWIKKESIEDYTGYTKVELSGFLNVYQNGDLDANNNHNLYLKTSTTVPGTAWQVKGKIKAEINGKEVYLSIDKNSDNSIWLNIPATELVYGQDATVVIKAGKYICTNESGAESEKIYFEKDWTFYASKYGVSTKDSILEKNVTVVSPKVNGGDGSKGYFLTTDKTDTLIQDWTTYIKPVRNEQSSDDTMYYYHGTNSDNGWKLDGTMQDSTMILKHPEPQSYFVGLIDVYPSDIAPDGTYELCGAYCDPTGNIVVFNSYEVNKTTNGENVLYTSPTDTPTYTSFDITKFKRYTIYNAENSIYHIYLTTDAEALPGTAWVERFNLDVMVGEQQITVEAMKCDDAQTLYFSIPKDKIPEGVDTTITVKAGKYACNDTSILLGYDIKTDFKFYASKHGFSTNDKILDKNVKKAGLKLGTDLNNSAAVYLAPTVDDGLEPDGTWGTRWYAATDTGEQNIDTDAIYFNNQNGVKIDGVYYNGNDTSSGRLPFVRLNEYYVAFGDIGITPTVGCEYTIGGVFYSNVDGQLIEFTPITVKWDGTTWSRVAENLTDTGVEGDVNGDGYLDIRDLVRIIKYYNTDGQVDVNESRLDINHDGTKNEADIASLRKVLAGYVAYVDDTEGGANATPSGTPIYSKSNKIEIMAYSCPKAGEWTDGEFIVSETLASDFKDYKDAGFTLLNSEFVAVLKDDVLDETHQIELVTYLKEAKRQGLGVIVASDYIFLLLKNYSTSDGTLLIDEKMNDGTLKWKFVLKQYIDFLEKYPAFKGFMMADELSIDYLDNYKKVCDYLKELKSDINLHSSQLPVSAYQVETLGAESLTKDTETNNTKELAYKDYVRSFGVAKGGFTYDLYPLTCKETNYILSQKTEYSINSEWFDNLKWTTDVIKENNYNITMGVTIQSCKLAGTDNIFSKNERYAPEQKSDIGFQIYTAMAYGTKEINYFTYMDHPTDEIVEESIKDNDNVRKAVTEVNKEIAGFGYVYNSFNWKDTLDIEKGKSNNSTGNQRLTSVKTTGGRILVGCMKDEDGFDGYMVANAEEPRTSNDATVTMKFKNAKSVTVYKGTTSEKVEITDGTYTATVNVGEGIFVIPNYN